MICNLSTQLTWLYFHLGACISHILAHGTKALGSLEDQNPH